MGSPDSSHFPHACRWIGYAKYPIGVNKCVNACVRGPKIHQDPD